MSVTERDSKTDPKVARPKRYTVVFLNDDFTPVEFVIEVMIKVFSLSSDEAEAITMDIHKNGRGNAGVYSYEVAETKAAIVMDAAKRHEFPLTCKPEPV
jgi:ATP-dependent Clp protease adaptor protein ClpS